MLTSESILLPWNTTWCVGMSVFVKLSQNPDSFTLLLLLFAIAAKKKILKSKWSVISFTHGEEWTKSCLWIGKCSQRTNNISWMHPLQRLCFLSDRVRNWFFCSTWTFFTQWMGFYWFRKLSSSQKLLFKAELCNTHMEAGTAYRLTMLMWEMVNERILCWVNDLSGNI